ncbi:activating signal cointegrator 1 complex subunit 2 [Phlebotomus argentipes]|uniref:activating signal cointegrator 1 complex subunit 2 n=1 Tax=Phlebotomus argentipes TaxID=94469 RepID=UPI00289359F3|nr:activating signal cointegrator 1 complex subunit 2 [Phlebotomus argentipes]
MQTTRTVTAAKGEMGRSEPSPTFGVKRCFRSLREKMKNYQFNNAENKPLEELKLSWEGCQIPAMSEEFAVKRYRAKYTALPMEDLEVTTNDEAIGEWIQNTQLFEMEIESLLKLDFHRFWTTMLFDSEAINSITSFLQESTPCYLPLPTITSNQEIIGLYARILQKVLAVVCRLITNKDSDTEWISKQYLATVIYSNYLISIPLFFDLLTTYGRTNGGILEKIFENIVKIEPKYLSDLEQALRFIQKSFATIEEQLGKGSASETVQLLNDLCLHTLDCATSLSILMDVCPASRDICVKINMEQIITSVYDNFIPNLYRCVYMYDEKSPYVQLLNRARVELLSAFRSIVNTFIGNILIENQKAKVLELVEALLSIFTLSLSDNVFVTDYQSFYPIENDIEILRQACPKMDTFKADFILQAFLSGEENNFAKLPKQSTKTNYINGCADLEEEGACALPMITEQDAKLSSVDIEEQVKIVQDILPDFGDGFVRKLLSRYENTESAIAAVLEGNLPPDLDKCDKTEIYIPPDNQEQQLLEAGVSRINIFDGDDYDVRVKEKPKGIIKTGKGFPGQPKTAKDLLDDKSHVKELKSRYEAYSMVMENDYDDEYDDSFDAQFSTTAKRPQSTRDVLVDEISSQSEDEEEETEPETSVKKNSLNFCENPETLRAKYEQKRQQKYGNPKRDVVGKAKGQGQTEAVLTNRNKKEVHKSSRANHNRKQGSSWKRNRGMIPS